MQNEILLNLAREDFGADRLALVTSDDDYGETFREWFGFQAEEMQSVVNSVELLGDELSVRQVVENFRIRHRDAIREEKLSDSEDLTFFFPSSAKDLLTLDRVLTQMDDTEWERYDESIYWASYTACSDRCVDYDIAGQIMHTFFGVEPAPLPGSGFAAAYETKYGRYPKNGTAQAFDAVYLLTYALCVMDSQGEDDSYNPHEGVPGVLFLTAANSSETSKADIVDKELKTYLSNGFTRGFQQRIDSEPDVTLRDLYYHVAGQTVGSHARMYNIPAFGSVFKTTMAEFLK